MDTKTVIVLLSCFMLQETISCPSRDISLVEEDRKCRRSCVSHDNCTATNKGCYCDSVCGLSCLNKMSECPQPAGIANGSVTWSHLHWDGRAHYSCHEGYKLIGEERRRCNADKKWGGKPPACVLSECPQPAGIANGSVTWSHLHWDGRAHYSCHEGYKLIGEERRRCNADEKWGGKPPVCVQLCHRPTDAPSSYPANGEYGFEFGKSYDFSCNSGYYMTGNLTRICSEDGWSEAQFICQLVQCDALRYVENGDITKSHGHFFGSIASVQCYEGYRSSSPTQTKRCYPGDPGSAYGEWMGNLPSCTAIRCVVPVAPSYGLVQDVGYVVPEYGTKIIYQCQNGYKLVGPNSGRCNEDGNWGEIPSCVEDFDCNFSDPSSRTCRYTAVRWSREESNNRSRGHIMKSGRSHSYLTSPVIPSRWTALCLTFSYKLPSNKHPTADDLTVEYGSSEPVKVYWRPHLNEQQDIWLAARVTMDERTFQFHASRISIFLDDIVVIPGECHDFCHNVTCSNGASCANRISSYACICAEGFSGDHCELETSCNAVFVRENSRLLNLTTRWVFGDHANYVCDEGYHSWDPDTEQMMPMSITCQSDSSWSGKPPHCVKPFCIFTGGRSNGPTTLSPKSRYNIGETMHLICSKGYRLEGDAFLTCVSMLVWEKPNPSCQKVSCGNMPEIPHATLSFSPILRFEEFVDYASCERGYYLEGPRRVTCRFDGSFSRLPVCIRIKGCTDTFSRMKNGRKSVQAGDAYFYCNSMFTLVGERKISCLNDGTWEHRAPYCKEIEPKKRVFHDNIEYLAFMDPWLKSNYDDAQSKCGNLDGNLAILYDSRITDKLEEDLKPVQEHHYKLYIALRSVRGSEFEWDDSNVRTYLSDSRIHSGHRRWQSGAHSSPDEHECAVIERERPNVWNIFTKYFGWMPTRCWEKNYFICQRDFDLCTPNPCENGGTCYVSQEQKLCSCLDGFTGKSCSTEILCRIEDLGSNIITYHKTRTVRIGSEIMIGCPEGYRLVGSDTALCDQNGRWSTPRERCLEIICNQPELSEDILVSETQGIYTAGSQLFFSCPENHRLEGNPTAICRLDGQWSDVAVACKATRCSRPELPDQAYIRENIAVFPSGSFIELNCLSRRTLVGDPKWRCEDGKWLSTNATCIVQFCKIDLFLLGIDIEVEGIPLSDIMERTFNVSEELTLKCRDGSINLLHWDSGVSDTNIVCQEGGQWSPSYGGYSCEK